MKAALQAFHDLVLNHGAWAGPAFGLLALAESLAVVGTFVPATPMLFLIGTLLGQGLLDPVAVLPWAVAGAIAGYWLSWGAGTRLGPSIYHGRMLGGQRRGVARVRLFFRHWGGPSLLVGRFVLGPVHSMLPLVAGVARMTPRRFHTWNVLSGIMWIGIVVAPGWLAARGLIGLGFDGSTQQAVVGSLALISVVLILLVLGAALLRWAQHARR